MANSYDAAASGTRERIVYSPGPSQKTDTTQKESLDSNAIALKSEITGAFSNAIHKEHVISATLNGDSVTLQKNINGTVKATAMKVSELAKELKVSKKTILNAQKLGKLPELINELTKLNVGRNSGNKMLDGKVVRKIVARAVIDFKNNSHEYKKVGSIFNRKTVLITKNDSGGVFISKYAGNIASGSYGVVHKSKVEGYGTTAVKIAKDDDKSREDVQNEYKMLTSIHTKAQAKGESVIGIQAPPHTAIKYATAGTEQVGYIGTLYDGTAGKLIDKGLDQKQTLGVMFQVFNGLNTMREQGILHGDIKPQNMLYREHPSTTLRYEVVLSDFGGATKDGTEPDTRTEDYLHPNDIAAHSSSSTSAATKKEIFHQMDTYATAISLRDMFVRDITTKPTSYNWNKLPPQISNLLQRALDPDYTKRPKPEAFLNAIANHLKAEPQKPQNNSLNTVNSSATTQEPDEPEIIENKNLTNQLDVLAKEGKLKPEEKSQIERIQANIVDINKQINAVKQLNKKYPDEAWSRERKLEELQDIIRISNENIEGIIENITNPQL